jgi:formate dehydrogenase iron-sulfur subunit
MSSNIIALQNKFLGHGETVYDRLSELFERQGYISDEDIDRLAEEHNLPPAHVRATAKFYDDLSHAAPATRTVKICNGEACSVAGGRDVEAALTARLGVGPGGTNSDGVRFEHVTCVGFCGRGPNGMVDDAPISLAAPDAVDDLVASLEAGGGVAAEPPVNAVHLPAEGRPCIVLRHFDGDVVGIEAARTAGVYDALETALTSMAPPDVIAEITASRLRGRGGAGFPTGVKLTTVADAEVKDGSGRRFVVVNCDEGDAGSYIDKELVERDPHTQIEAALLAAYACGAGEVVFYVRSEYPAAYDILGGAISEARAAGIVGQPAFGSSFSCEARIVQGRGAYICGEETSLLRSIEGVPALVSIRPPFPAHEGLWGCPTAVQNVETLHNLPWIVANGGEAYARYGLGDSRGTKAVSLNTRVARPGLYEVELGTTLNEIIFGLAGGMADGEEFKAVQIGGPLGSILGPEALDAPFSFEGLTEAGGILGHGGIVVYSQNDDLAQIALGLMRFCAVESCGRCFPCRIGAVRGSELLDRMLTDGVTDDRLELLADLCETMKYGSLCGLGKMLPDPIESVMRRFPQEFERYRRGAG